MRIETVSPELKGVPEEIDIEKQILENETVSHESVKAYASFIIQELERIRNTDIQDQKIFIIDSLSDEHILSRVAHKVYDSTLEENERLDEAEAKAIIQRIRKALMEELRGKIDEKLLLVIKDFKKNTDRKDATVVSLNKRGLAPKRSIVSEVVEIGSGKKFIYKDQDPPGGNSQDFAEALAIFKELPQHPNIADVKYYNQKSNRSVHEKRNFVTLKEYLESPDFDEQALITSLKVLRDCVSGARFLSDNNLVLQDISVYNMGVEDTGEDKKGLLFDIEGLVKKGKSIHYRISNLSLVHANAMLDYSQEDVNCVSPYEMVYQFGLGLDKIKEAYMSSSKLDAYDFTDPEKYKVVVMINKIRDLYTDMTRTCRSGMAEFDISNEGSSVIDKVRIDIREVEKRLSEIIEEAETVFKLSSVSI